MRKARLVLLAMAALSSACGGGTSDRTATPVRRPVPAKAPRVSGPPALRSAEVTRVPEGTFGPYVGQGRDGALLVWAPLIDDKRAWLTLPLAPDGTPGGEPRRVAEAAEEIGLVAVRGSLDSAGLVVVSTRRTGLSEWVEAMLVRPNGEVVMPPRALAEVPSGALWVDATVSAERTLVMWAIKHDDVADVRGLVLTARGEPKGDPVTLGSAVRAWQAVPFAGGTALGVVRPKREKAPGPTVEVSLFDADGRERGTPVVVSADGRPELDFDLTPLGDTLIVAWSDSRDGESRVYRAVLGADGRVRVPAGALTTPLGEQALVRVLSRRGSPRAWAVWESPGEREGSLRSIDVASVGQDGTVSSQRGRIILESEDGTVPELAAVGDGLAALTLAPECGRDADCSEADVSPTFVRFGSTLDVLASEPLRLDVLGGGPAELGWGLTCGDSTCFSLAALGKAPAPVYVVELEKRSDAFAPAARKLADEGRPRLRENRVLALSEPLAAVALARTGTGSLSAYLTDFDPTTPWVKLKKPGPDGRYEPLRARLTLLGLRPDGAAARNPVDLSVRAHSLGGIALAGPLQGASGDVLVAWSGVDAGQPQVFLTLVAASGEKHTQRMLTRKSLDASDVAATAVSGGYVVAWVDERDKDPELYVSKVDSALTRVGVEHRVTKAPGPATEVSIAPAGDGAIVAWADARKPDHPGEADIYVVRVAGRDGTPAAGERLLLDTRGHSFAPVLRAVGDGFLLAWLERGEPDAPDSAGLVIQMLDATGASKGEPERTPLPDGEPGSLAIDCSNGACRFVVALRDGEDARLVAGVQKAPVGAGAAVPLRLKRIVSLGSKSAARVPLGLAGDELVYADADGDGRWRVRRALVDWPSG